jgi:hypothetical protein
MARIEASTDSTVISAEADSADQANDDWNGLGGPYYDLAVTAICPALTKQEINPRPTPSGSCPTRESRPLLCRSNQKFMSIAGRAPVMSRWPHLTRKFKRQVRHPDPVPVPIPVRCSRSCRKMERSPAPELSGSRTASFISPLPMVAAGNCRATVSIARAPTEPRRNTTSGCHYPAGKPCILIRQHDMVSFPAK